MPLNTARPGLRTDKTGLGEVENPDFESHTKQKIMTTMSSMDCVLDISNTHELLIHNRSLAQTS